MASGFGVSGHEGRCYKFWTTFSECMMNTDDPAQCMPKREDYLECLHHRKEYLRHNMVQLARKEKMEKDAEQMKEDLWKKWNARCFKGETSANAA
mmetsp:Transcript_28361/g.92620  ORF Transcript_28361/g.92620 Transcript_28361/m.92620 type:complete len:95 (+) Transcript_28361:1-285(+)